MTISDPHFPLLRDLALPARDILRGLKHGLGLAPLREVVPDPLRGPAHAVAAGVDRAARVALWRRRGAEAPGVVALAEILASRGAAPRFAAAARHGLDAALRRMGRVDLMVSETVAALAWRAALGAAGPDAARSDLAARLALSLVEHHAAGAAPGTPLGIGAEETRLARLAAFATLLWMILERDAAREDEAALLALCVDLTASLADEVAAADADPGRLAALLAAYAPLV